MLLKKKKGYFREAKLVCAFFLSDTSFDKKANLNRKRSGRHAKQLF